VSVFTSRARDEMTLDDRKTPIDSLTKAVRTGCSTRRSRLMRAALHFETRPLSARNCNPSTLKGILKSLVNALAPIKTEHETCERQL
jgi:hypothetical protein